MSLGPLISRTTSAFTEAPSRKGLPRWSPSSRPMARTSLRETSSPFERVALETRSMRTTSPALTRSCFPPVLMTAYMIERPPVTVKGRRSYHRRSRLSKGPSRPSSVSALELHRRWLLGTLGRLEVGTLPEPGEVRHDHRRERPAQRVVGLRQLIEPPPLDRNSVLGPFELCLELPEVLRRLQLGVLLHRHEEAG